MIKDLKYYMSLPYKMEIIEDLSEGGFTASFPELPGCITCGENIADTAQNALDAKKEWLRAAIEDGIEIPEPKQINDYSGQFKLRMPKSLHLSLAEHSRQENISMNQYCIYLLSKADAEYALKKPDPDR
jgi:antitoxin HicB